MQSMLPTQQLSRLEPQRRQRRLLKESSHLGGSGPLYDVEVLQQLPVCGLCANVGVSVVCGATSKMLFITSGPSSLLSTSCKHIAAMR